MATGKVGLTTWAEGKLLNQILLDTPAPTPSNVFLALFTTDPGEAGTGSEVTGGGYARLPITFNPPAAQASPATGSICENSAAIQTAIATAAWGNVGFVGIMDAATNGNMWLYGEITTPKTVTTGDRITFEAGAVQVLMD